MSRSPFPSVFASSSPSFLWESKNWSSFSRLSFDDYSLSSLFLSEAKLRVNCLKDLQFVSFKFFSWDVLDLLSNLANLSYYFLPPVPVSNRAQIEALSGQFNRSLRRVLGENE